MPLVDAFHYVFRTNRKAEVSREDGTPVFANVPVDIPCWFDQPDGSRATLATRLGMAQPVAERRARIWTSKDQDPQLAHHMEGEVLGPDGESYGSWTIEVVRAVPGFRGVSHYEAEAQGAVESR